MKTTFMITTQAGKKIYATSKLSDLLVRYNAICSLNSTSLLLWKILNKEAYIIPKRSYRTYKD